MTTLQAGLAILAAYAVGLPSFAIGTALHEVGHAVAALLVGVHPTVVGVFSRRDAEQGRCLAFMAGVVRVEIGLCFRSSFVTFDDQHPRWRRAADAPGSLRTAAPWRIVFIALAGPVGHSLAALLFVAPLHAQLVAAPVLRPAFALAAAVNIGFAAANLLPLASSDAVHCLRAMRGLPLVHFRSMTRHEEALALAGALLATIAALLIIPTLRQSLPV